MDRYASDSDEIYSVEGVLKNRLGVTNSFELQQIEAAYCAIRMVEMNDAPAPMRFDLSYLCEIHRRLFSDVYDWAGSLRRVNMKKGDTLFASAEMIEPAAESLFANLAKENELKGLANEGFAERAAYYLGEINVLHPFREGNGRVQRAFVGNLAKFAGYRIAWAGVSADEMIRASIAAYEADRGPMTELILRNLSASAA